jgi:hypothetical protein
VRATGCVTAWLSMLGINLLRALSVPPAGSVGAASGQPTVASRTFALHLGKEGIIATAREIDGEFTILQGSHARQSWVSTPELETFRRQTGTRPSQNVLSL